MKDKKNKTKSVKIPDTLEKRKGRWGYVFIAPWIVGFICFFAIPLVNAIYYTFTKITITQSGLNFSWVGFENYLQAFTVDPDFSRNIVESILNIVYQVPIIVFFSLFIALILHGDFKGRTLMRSIFFLPVIISSGVVITILQENVMTSGTGQASTLFQTGVLSQMLVRSGFPSQIVKVLTDTVGAIFDLTWRSGVQILLLLSALHSIPDSMYEAAKIEGATGWEIFWKITFVMISPTLIMTILYSIIDYFTDYSNKIMRMIVDYVSQGRYEYSTTISIIYFAIVMVIIMLINVFLTRASNKALN
ncbi:MAG: sugar ABC transporter permease [Treponema sp.]